jgi:hypothetical protein
MVRGGFLLGHALMDVDNQFHSGSLNLVSHNTPLMSFGSHEIGYIYPWATQLHHKNSMLSLFVLILYSNVRSNCSYFLLSVVTQIVAGKQELPFDVLGKFTRWYLNKIYCEVCELRKMLWVPSSLAKSSSHGIHLIKLSHERCSKFQRDVMF